MASLQDVTWLLLTDSEINWDSLSNLVIVPMQDLLGLDEQARMNRPAKLKGNWSWQMSPQATRKSLATTMAKMTTTYGRG